MLNQIKIKFAIRRIKKMENYFQEVKNVFLVSKESILFDEEYNYKLKCLKKYFENKWLKDYELDEKNLLPSDLKRGVLSQDELYNLLVELKLQN